MDCSAFLNWDESQDLSESENAVVFRSLIAQMKLQPVFDDTLEEKAVNFLEFMTPTDRESADAFLNNFGPSRDDSLTVFVQSIEVLMSSSSQTITKSAMKMLEALVVNCSTKVRFALVKAGLIPQLINTLNPQTLSFATAVDIHINLIGIIINTVWLSSPGALAELGIENGDETQTAHETVLKQVVSPSEKLFLTLLAHLIELSPFHQPTMDFVLHMPVMLTIPNCLTFFEYDRSIWYFVVLMINYQREWNDTRGDEQQMWQTVYRMLRMEGIEDVIETKLQNNESTFGRRIVAKSIDLSNLQASIFPTLSRLSNLYSGRSNNTSQIVPNHLLSTQLSRLIHPVSDPTPPDVARSSFTTCPCHSLPLPRGCTAWTCTTSSSLCFGFGSSVEGLTINPVEEVVLVDFGIAGQVGRTVKSQIRQKLESSDEGQATNRSWPFSRHLPL
ncbi:hypothetical protein BLNAU_9682 [Blattamonas nauphoetae]|uniref:Uncharacterized protein n=1 Tax=Blattamonas nauphoetae TaxID=2049346 RepID=A0ABQ9XUY8_9EUKA|nr:hypothetical protein BLNAU_9682 [Blattamonas nauphoetae]